MSEGLGTGSGDTRASARSAFSQSYEEIWSEDSPLVMQAGGDRDYLALLRDNAAAVLCLEQLPDSIDLKKNARRTQASLIAYEQWFWATRNKQAIARITQMLSSSIIDK